MSRNESLGKLVLDLQARVADLERQLTEFRKQTAQSAEKDWRRTIGMFAGDEVMKRIFEAGADIRRQERQRIKNRTTKRRRAPR